jgi:outer membrane lipoprotein SlyB
MKRLPVSIGILVVIAAVLVAGCTRDRESVRSAEAAQTPAVETPRYETLVIPDGTSVVASLDTRLSTKTNRTGDPFGATTTEPIIVGGRTLVPAGARIHGVLRDVEASGRTSGRARMTLAYETIADSEGKTHPISSQPLTLQAASTTHGDVEKIAAGGVLGALIGGVTGGGKGAAIGAGAGAGAGTVLMLATKGKEVELETGQRLNVHMTASTSIQVLAQR